ncbi:hypothetical protein G6F63_013988 [Rhizopus arrhizus]|nr:hypothetical protein G6F65_022028 [Rhizopus arrhizus]KAG1321000.1 hypothetical protein G6F63_013988 [Rhizopus arrhizus]
MRLGRQRQVPAVQHAGQRLVRQGRIAPAVPPQQFGTRLLQIDQLDVRVIGIQQIQRLLAHQFAKVRGVPDEGRLAPQQLAGPVDGQVRHHAFVLAVAQAQFLSRIVE